ncbi:hypothetical protein BJV82DRAFT_667849 [Fennellomyces sp. T-0311]|nr:hypothetical protein BJV82DRAFT_667849 [Fennellomyces sp. T-0311]
MDFFNKNLTNTSTAPATCNPVSQMDVDEHELATRLSETNGGSEQPETTGDIPMSDPPPAGKKARGKKAAEKAKGKKRGNYVDYNPEQFKTALCLLYVENFYREDAAEQMGINYLTLNNFVNDRVKNHGFPKLPRKPRRQKSDSADVDADINKYFEEEIRPLLKK